MAKPGKADVALVLGGPMAPGGEGGDMEMEMEDDMESGSEFDELAADLGFDAGKMRMLLDAFMMERE